MHAGLQRRARDAQASAALAPAVPDESDELESHDAVIARLRRESRKAAFWSRLGEGARR